MSGHEPADWSGPVRVGRSVDTVTDRLVTAIAVGDFSPRERLPPERELATLLGVGRETLRAALGRLRDAGYVATRRGRNGGAIVQDGWGALSDDAVRRTLAPSRAELSDARCLIESLIARTAAERRQPEDVTAMTAALEAYEQAADAVAARRAAHDLHHAIIRAARNQHLAKLSRELLARVNVGVPIEPFEEATFRAVAPQHRALIEAVVARDGDAAAAVAREHFAITTEAVRRALDRAG